MCTYKLECFKAVSLAIGAMDVHGCLWKLVLAAFLVSAQDVLESGGQAAVGVHVSSSSSLRFRVLCVVCRMMCVVIVSMCQAVYVSVCLRRVCIVCVCVRIFVHVLVCVRIVCK